MTTAVTSRLTAGPVETTQAKAAWDGLATTVPERWIARTHDQQVEVGRELSMILTSIIEILASGGTVTVGSMPEILTTTSAARVLGISRTALMKHVESGAIPSHKVGSHTRLRSSDVQAFRRARLERQRAAFAELLELEDSLGE